MSRDELKRTDWEIEALERFYKEDRKKYPEAYEGSGFGELKMPYGFGIQPERIKNVRRKRKY